MNSEMAAFLSPLPAASFAVGDVVIPNTYLQKEVADRTPRVAWVKSGLVCGAWHRPVIAPSHSVAIVVAGDGCWVGMDAFKYRENLFQYSALAPTTAVVLSLADFVAKAPRGALLDALEKTSLEWCTAASVVSMRRQPLGRRAMLLLYNLRRLHPRPDLEVTQKVVAELLGVSRQALNPVLKALEGRGLVRLGYGKILIQEHSRIIEELRRTAAGPEGLEHRAEMWDL